MAKKNFNFKKLNLNLGNLGNLENLKETLSDTISTVADKVLDFADSAADNAKIGQQIAKLFLEKKKEESALEDAYKELGKLYYDMHKTEAEGVLADLCMEIENTLINIEDINAEIEALKEANNVDFENFDEGEIHIVMDEDEDEGFLERMAETAEEALEGLDEAIEAALDKLEAVVDPEIEMDDEEEIEVSVEEYLDDDDFVAPEQDDDIVVVVEEYVNEDDFVAPEQDDDVEIEIIIEE